MSFKKNQFLYKGSIYLTSSNKLSLQLAKKEIFDLLENSSLNIKDINLVKQTKKSKYITIFKSPFVYKKAKDTFLFEKYSLTLNFHVSNLLILKLLIIKLENYKEHVDASIKVSSTSNIKTLSNLRFGTENFKKLIIQK
jgi:ribosomal protein S10